MYVCMYVYMYTNFVHKFFTTGFTTGFILLDHISGELTEHAKSNAKMFSRFIRKRERIHECLAMTN